MNNVRRGQPHRWGAEVHRLDPQVDGFASLLRVEDHTLAVWCPYRPVLVPVAAGYRPHDTPVDVVEPDGSAFGLPRNQYASTVRCDPRREVRGLGRKLQGLCGTVKFHPGWPHAAVGDFSWQVGERTRVRHRVVGGETVEGFGNDALNYRRRIAGDRATIEDSERQSTIEITFVGVREDTRCPDSRTATVLCTWSGSVEVEMMVSDADQHETFSLIGVTDYNGVVEGSIISEADSTQWHFAGYLVVLAQVTPYPREVRLSLEAYVIEVIVSHE